MKQTPIKAIRLRKRITQEELSRLTNYTQGYVSFVESGKRVPSYDNLVVFAEALNCTVEELSEGAPKNGIVEAISTEVSGLSQIELEKTLDYIQVLKRGRR